jgi:hypothetical protein
MKRFKIVGLCLVAVFAISAVASASASAADVWSVEGSTVFGGTAKTEAISPSPISITGGKLTGDGIEITCPTLTINGGLIKEGSSGSATSVAFSGCLETVDQAECVLESSTITTVAVTANIVGTNEIEFKPTTGTEFVTVKLNNVAGKVCPVKGKFKVTGSARATFGTAQEEEVSHTLTLNSKSALFINENASTIAGSGSLKLTSGKKWSMQP